MVRQAHHQNFVLAYKYLNREPVERWCLYRTKLAPISKTNDVARSACVGLQCGRSFGKAIFWGKDLPKLRLICF